jgi:SAM-dependent methyltransferase
LITNLVDCNKALPFPDDQFGLTYNVNFIHFIVDIQQFYAEQYRILENKGIVFTATHSEQDFKSQSMGYYFPESIKIEMNKTPSIKEIIEAMRTVGFKDIRINTITDSLSIDPLFLNACQAKVFSCLHEISELSYSKGVKKIEQDMAKGVKGSVNYSIIRGEK